MSESVNIDIVDLLKDLTESHGTTNQDCTSWICFKQELKCLRKRMFAVRGVNLIVVAVIIMRMKNALN